MGNSNSSDNDKDKEEKKEDWEGGVLYDGSYTRAIHLMREANYHACIACNAPCDFIRNTKNGRYE